MYKATAQPFAYPRDVTNTHAEFHGPGLSRYANVAIVWREHDAETICRLLSEAYEAGRRAKATEIRSAIGAGFGF